MASTPPMTVQQVQSLLKKLINAKNGAELQKIVADNVMWCDGVFFAELGTIIKEYQQRGDTASAQKLKTLGDYMARLRFMI